MSDYIDSIKKAQDLRRLLEKAKSYLGTGVVYDPLSAPLKTAGDPPWAVLEQMNKYIKEHKLVIPTTDRYGVVSFETIKPTKMIRKKPKTLEVKTMLPKQLPNKFAKRVDKYMESVKGEFKYDKESLRKIYDHVFRILFKCVREEVDKQIQRGLLLKCDLLELPEDGKKWENFRENKLCPTFSLDMEDKLKRFLFE
jgi:hypothetical protein